ncbi:MAG: 30S ribosomal protein S4 [Candidatus Paceibacterota bacterium]|jgi:small subunit ribosomal protein S4
MITGPRYKIARRLGTSVYDKTQTPKYAMRASSKEIVRKKRAGSDFGLQLIEKQRARFTYGLGEKQFKNLVEKVQSKRDTDINEALVQALESRLDNAIYRLGFASTRQASRQMVNHGHIDVNGKRNTIPSYQLSMGDIVSIRENSKKKPLFKDLDEKLKEIRVPSWLAFNKEKKEAKVQGLPKIPANEIAFDVSQIFQYYSR